MARKNGILLQGPISDWTVDIINKYKKKFPDTTILLSTWKDQNIDQITCDVIQIDAPEFPKPNSLSINHQIIGSLAGLEKISCDIVMKCRTDQFVNNKNIFKLYEQNCPKNKIMIPNYTTVSSINYLASDFCQIATKKILIEYWKSVPLYDGSVPFTHAEIYLNMNYILHAKKDLGLWPECLRKYFYVKGFNEDFQIKWEKLEKHIDPYQRWYDEWYSKCVKPDP